MKKFTIYNLQFTILTLLLLLIALLLLPTTNYQLPTTTYAQQPCPTQTSNPRAGGLISTPDISGSENKFSNASGVCVIDPKVAFYLLNIKSYPELVSIYFDQSRFPPSQKITLTCGLTSCSQTQINLSP